jgi:hypothetical protein
MEVGTEAVFAAFVNGFGSPVVIAACINASTDSFMMRGTKPMNIISIFLVYRFLRDSL